MKVEMPDVMGFFRNIQAPLEFMCQDVSQVFPQIRMNCFQRNCLPSESLHADQRRITQQSSGRGSGANEGQIYVHHSGDLSCFAYGDGCAATSKLSHNVRLNRCAITSFSLWKLELCKVCAALTSLLSLTFNAATARLLLHAAQITRKVSIFMSRSWNYVLYMDLDFQIVTLSSIKWHKSTCVNGFSVTDKLCVHVWAAWQVQMSTLTFLSGSGRWVGY